MSGKLTKVMADDMARLIELLDGAQKLASANFPRTTDLRIETLGSNPSVSMVVPAWFLAKLCEAGRAALSKGGTDE